MRIGNQGTLSQYGISFGYQKTGYLMENDTQKDESASVKIAREIKDRLRQIEEEKERQKNHTGISSNAQSILNTDNTREEDSEIKIQEKYNYKEVSSQIRQAKNSISAGKALLSAKRKVTEIRRKIAAHNGDAKELQLALTHAKRMEMVARKKKHHLELEELIAHTQKSDDMQEKTEERNQELHSALIETKENALQKKEDELFEAREKYFDEMSEEINDTGEDTSDMLLELNEEIASLGEDELQKLEEDMELLENLEIINPHMDEEAFQKIKTKHRNNETKDMVKADMDYLKSLIKYQTQEPTSTVQNFSSFEPQIVDIKL